jgi:hypothetical protein
MRNNLATLPCPLLKVFFYRCLLHVILAKAGMIVVFAEGETNEEDRYTDVGSLRISIRVIR